MVIVIEAGALANACVSAQEREARARLITENAELSGTVQRKEQQLAQQAQQLAQQAQQLAQQAQQLRRISVISAATFSLRCSRTNEQG